MTIKRYTPKYKVLAKFKHALWLEKRSKIKKFNRQKWEGKEKLYFPKKLKFFDQDSSTCIVGSDFENDRSIRLKKTYKHLLQDKQGFQLYYGSRRLRFYQLRYMALLARQFGKKKKLSSAKVFFHLMENRLEIVLCRLGYVSSLMQAKRLLTTSCVKVDDNYVKNFGFRLKYFNIVKIEAFKSVEILARYLKFNTPFFYFRKKDDRKFFLVDRREFLRNSFLEKENLAFLSFIKGNFLKLKALKKKNY